MAVILSFYFCCYSVHNVWTKWDEKPVTLDLSETEALISSIPFPTITICPNTKFYKEKVDILNAYAAWENDPASVSDIEYDWKAKIKQNEKKNQFDSIISH